MLELVKQSNLRNVEVDYIIEIGGTNILKNKNIIVYTKSKKKAERLALVYIGCPNVEQVRTNKLEAITETKEC